ncbi:BRF1-domain-containing protein [Setomelanomma holmii]|uniref:BRF1-domain-containing protein n=1 Tax=Setomelanomma holmii TaxID=210430 RepID=A0A9P4H174_9PLEO|nr:BRF1-domain-containing protein [Setomelanomma holmii]
MSAVAAPRPPRVRLKTINASRQAGTITYTSEVTRQRALPPPPAKKATKRYNCCEHPNISSDEGSTVCYTCGTVHEESAIVSEVTFGETAGGAAMVEGGFIGENQRHANSMGGTMRGLGGMASREQAEMMGRSEIEKIGGSLYVRQSVREQALGWYRLAMNHNFIQGRRMRNVAAVALYMAARRQPGNTLMLMDLAEKIQVNVWALGDTYKAFLGKLTEVDPAQLVGNTAVQEIEPLMLKYCRKLEFAEDSHKVANDACKILRRMSRDWMVQGRQPAGLCGACIILAARMNNYRRTVREVVYVVKVADSTINSRLYEYKQTPSSALTVNQFREFGERLKVTVQPPAIWRREKKEERREKRKAAGVDPDSAAALEQSAGSETEAGPSTGTSSTRRTSKRRRNNNGVSQSLGGQDNPVLDGNGEAVLESLDVAMADASDGNPGDEAFVMPKKRGRPKKRDRIVIAPEDLEIEQEIESEVTHAIKDWEATFKEFIENDKHPILQASGWTAQQMARAQLDQRDIPVNTSPDIDEDEFDDDPDVANCILGPEEVRLKERIWITENEDWLRDQQTKLLKAELEAAEDKPKKPKQKRKHHQMGDGSVLEGQPAASAAEAVHKMLNKRGKAFSNHLNYDKLNALFAPPGSSAGSPSAGGSGQGNSPSASQAQTPPVIQIQDEDAEGEEEEEYEEPQQYAEEEEDLEQQYRSDEDDYANEYDDNY